MKKNLSLTLFFITFSSLIIIRTGLINVFLIWEKVEIIVRHQESKRPPSYW